MGLLGDSWDDPKTQAVLQLSAGLLSGGNFGQALGKGLAGYQQSMSSAEEAAQRKELMDWKRQEVQAARATEARKQQFLGLVGQQFGGVTPTQALAAPLPTGASAGDPGQLTWPPQPAAAKPGQVGPTIERAALIGQRAPVDWQQMMAAGMAAGFTPEQIKALAEAQNLGRQEVARVEETTDAQGRPIKRQLSKFGDQVGGDLGVWKDKQVVNFGDAQYTRDPVTGKLELLRKNGLSPDSAASNALGWANVGLSRERLQFDKSQAGKPQFHDGAWVLPPSAQNPQGAAISVPGMPQKPLTEGQAKANLFGTRAMESQKILSELYGQGTDRPGPWKRTAESTVGVLPTWAGRDGLVDAVGALTNWTQNSREQRVEQAQRDFINAILRRESGAAIAESEFSNARKQYFPQVGDSKAVIEQKARNRQLAIEGLQAEVPGGFRRGGASGGVIDFGALK